MEEKVDGANLGFSVDEHGSLRAQNRGTYLLPYDSHGQFAPLKRWLQPRTTGLVESLFPNLMLFGEWCYAVHSIRYTKLPDWFLAFDVYDRELDEFWSASRRNALAKELDLSVVPCLGTGTFDVAGLMSLLGRSRLIDGPAEGLYVRREETNHLVARAKLVRREFVEAMDKQHWSRTPLRPNVLASATK